MFENSYPGKCAVCGVKVEPGEGFVEKADRCLPAVSRVVSSRYATLCRSKLCITRALGEEAAKPPVRKLEADGTLRMPFDRDALPLIKAMPGARWNPEAKVWSVSVEPAHRADVLDLARRLDLEIADELLHVKQDPHVGICLDHPQLEHARPYQREGIEWMAARKRCLCADEMGLGKTYQTLMAIRWDAPVLIVCPKSVQGSWEREIQKWEVPLQPVQLKGRKSWRWPEQGEAVIVNWDILPKDCGDAPEGLQVIADEAHAASNPKAQRTKKFRAISKQAERVIGLTGTPIDKSPMQLRSVLSSIGCNPWSWTAFTRAFNGYKKQVTRFQAVWDWRRDERGAIIVAPGTRERLSTVMIQRKKVDVAKDLPPVTLQELPVKVSRHLSKTLDALSEQWGDMVLDDELPPFTAFAEIRKLLAADRIPAMLERVEEFESAETPLLVFSAHRAPIEALEGREGWAVIHGGIPADTRSQIVDDFQAGKLRGVGITISAGGVGLTLTHASHALFVDQSWAPRENQQARARLHRIGQVNAVTIELMTSDHVLDQHVARLLWGKEELVRRTLDRTYDYESPEEAELADEDPDAWAARVAAKQAEDERRAAEARKRELAKRTRGRKLTAEEAEERAEMFAAERDLARCPDGKAEAVKEAWAYLLSVCDGAREKDDSGFDGTDARLARWLGPAVAAGSPWALAVAYSRLPKYHRQVGEL